MELIIDKIILPFYPTPSDARQYVNSRHRIDTTARLDEDTFVQLYEAHYSELLAYASRLLGNQAQAQDMVQEAFLRLWKRKSEVDAGRYTRALLYKAVRNLALNSLRNDQRRRILLKTTTETESPPNPEATVGAELLKARVQAWIAELPERRREAFELSRFEGFSYDEIAGLMEISAKTVENHIVLALRHLRKRLDSFDPKLLQKP